MKRRIVLVIILRRIERLQRHHLGHDRLGKHFGFVELRDVRFRDLLLLVVAVENHRAILRAIVRPLPVQLRGIVGHREKHPQQFSIGDLRRIVCNLHRFGVAGFAGADDFIFRGLGLAARISRSRAGYTFYVLEDRLDAPETSARDHRGLFAGLRSLSGVDGRTRNGKTGSVSGSTRHRAHDQLPGTTGKHKQKI